jgi:CDP-diacylglycerol--glycerol-3-phosphate 3-phosphatidyltransferase
MRKDLTVESGLRRFSSVAFHPVGRFLAMVFSPNLLTASSLLVSGAVAYYYARGIFTVGSWLMLLAGILDIFDGQVAKLTDRVTVFGAFFDSTGDRVSDFLYSLGALYYFVYRNIYDMVFLLLVYQLVSQLISYVKARAESLGFTCNVGFLSRPLRMLLFGVPMFVYGYTGNIWTIKGPLLLVITLGFETALHRFVHVWRQSTKRSGQ